MFQGPQLSSPFTFVLAEVKAPKWNLGWEIPEPTCVECSSPPLPSLSLHQNEKNPNLFPELRTELHGSPLLWIQGSRHCNFIDIERFVPISSLLWLNCVDRIFCYLLILPSLSLCLSQKTLLCFHSFAQSIVVPLCYGFKAVCIVIS